MPRAGPPGQMPGHGQMPHGQMPGPGQMPHGQMPGPGQMPGSAPPRQMAPRQLPPGAMPGQMPRMTPPIANAPSSASQPDDPKYVLFKTYFIQEFFKRGFI